MIKKSILTLSVLFTLINFGCNPYIYPQYEKNTNQASELIKFDMTMSYNTTKIWAPIKIFELSKQNMPLDQEGLKIKSCVSKWTSSFLEETIKNDLIHLESQYKDTYKSNDNDLNKVMLDYIAVLIEFTTFIKDKYKNTEYTTENPEYPWENEILSIDSNDSRNSIAGKLDDAIEQYGILRNYNVGPLAQSLTKFQDDLSQPTFMHYMKKLAIEMTGVKSLKDSDNVDYSFYETNKEYLLNTELCKN